MSISNKTLHEEFPVNDNCIYLNHAAVAPWPHRATVAAQDFAAESMNLGASRYPEWMKLEQLLRDQFQTLINAASNEDIALLKNTSEALSVVAHGFPWNKGDNVVISDEEFPSNRIVWESLKDKGVTVKQANLYSARSPEDALIDACDSSTRLLAISSVEYSSGTRIDLQRLGKYCHDNGIAFCVDAIQGLGVFAHDVQAMHIDFLMADGHKWLCGPEALAVFYTSPQWRERLQLHQFGWHMTEVVDFSRQDWEPAHSARRFECGSPNMIGIYALSASLSLLLEIGIDTIETHVLERSQHMIKALDSMEDIEIITPTDNGRYAGIISFRHKKISNEDLFSHLHDNQVVCAMRGAGVRFSPHFHTPMAVIDKALQLVADAR
ncbi:MAG: aminotransferase class V-fold PLP-dependent enzyme [Proteobacteria bacterium]|nr:aminotransferase class V-fold PLP-dependent enzyme [Pseudomonadota bacterium]